MLAISAVALWNDAQRHEEATRTACEFLARPEMLTEQGRHDLEASLNRSVRMSGVQRQEKDGEVVKEALDLALVEGEDAVEKEAQTPEPRR